MGTALSDATTSNCLEAHGPRALAGGLGVAMLAMLAACGSTPWPDPVTQAAPGSAPDPRPTDSAVIVGIEDYDYLPDVRGAEANARDWQRYLRDVRRIPADRVRTVLDGRATREGILAMVDGALADVDRGGTVWFVFIGHGAARSTPDAGGHHEGLLIAADARPTTESIEGNSISQAELAATLSDHRHVVLLDACFTGTDRDDERFVTDLGLQLVDLSTVPSGALLTATDRRETAALLSKALRPAFSFAALGALQGWCEGRYSDAPADGRVTGPEVARCAREIIHAVNRDKHSPQFVATGDLKPLTLADGIGAGYDLDETLQTVIEADRPTRAGPLALIISGAAGLALGLGANVVNANQYEEWQSVDVGTERQRYAELRRALATSHDVAVGGYVVGGLLLAGGVAWRLALLAEDDDWLAVSPDARGLVWGGRF